MTEQSSHWNHRVLVHTNPPPFDNELSFIIHEVHYTDDVPRSYSATAATPGETSPYDLQVTLQRMAEALYKPILWAGEKFPQEYAPAMPRSYKLVDIENMRALAKEFGSATPENVAKLLTAVDEVRESMYECPNCKQLQEHRYPMSGTLYCFACGELLDDISKDDQ
jgi:ribosomal protein L37AE/L43A